METWDIALLVLAGYVATYGLASLMTRRRDQLIEQFREQMEENATQTRIADAESSESGKRQAA